MPTTYRKSRAEILAQPSRRDIACRRCGRWMTQQEDRRWRHSHDGSLGCVDPGTLKPYESDPKEDAMPTTMTAPTRQSVRLAPGFYRHLQAQDLALGTERKSGVKFVDVEASARELAGLRDLAARFADDEETKAGIRASAAAAVKVLDERLADADAAVEEPAEAEAPKAAENRTERLRLAKAEHAALAEWARSGEKPPRPATPNLDALEAETNGEKPKARSANKGGRPRKVSTVRYHVDGKPVTLAHNRLSGVSRVTGTRGGERMSTEDLRARLAAAGIADPDGSVWTHTLPNGVVLSTEPLTAE